MQEEYMCPYFVNNREAFCCPYTCYYMRNQLHGGGYRRLWYIHKTPGFCIINGSPNWPGSIKRWGPFNSSDEAVAKRFQLAKQGECKSDEITLVPATYYLHKFAGGNCEVATTPTYPNSLEHFGPYKSYDEAIAKRYELTKKGKCLYYR